MEDETMLPFDEFDEDVLSESLSEDADASSQDEPVAVPELLTVRLIREAVRRENPDDTALDDFARLVVPAMLRELAGHTAKGGMWWIEHKLAKGIKSDRSGEDQSLTAHLLNGLLPVTALIRCLRTLDTSIARYLDEKAYRFFIASYILHDWEKLPSVSAILEARFGQGFKPDPIKHRDVFEEILTEWAHRLGLDEFLADGGLGSINDHLDTLAWITQNTQEKYDTHRPTIGFKLTLPEKVCDLCANLTKMADKLASIVKHPADIMQKSLGELLYRLSDGKLRFTYHSLAEVRGVLTNIINNALLDAHRAKDWQPFLFFPNGAAYFGATEAEAIDAATLPDAVINKLQQLCSPRMEKNLIGFKRSTSGDGLKLDDNYWRFFDIPKLFEIGSRGSLREIREGSKPASASRLESLVEHRNKKRFPADIAFNVSSDVRIDQLAEFCDLAIRKIWQKAEEKYSLEGKSDLVQIVLDHLELGSLRENYDQLAAGVKSKAGGTPLDWYYVAERFFDKPINKGKSAEDLSALLSGLAVTLSNTARKSVKAVKSDGWNDLRSYINNLVMLPQNNYSGLGDKFVAELINYHKHKLPRGIRPCSLCSSPYIAKEQKETGILFMSQVFTNKQPLFSQSQAKRHICDICAIEMMLRQLLMNKSPFSGSKFEDAKYKYLYIYPTYYFTAETNRFLREVYQKLHATNFRTDVRDHLVNKKTHEIDFTISRFQSLDSLLIDESLDNEKDKFFRMQYPEDDPLTFFFAGVAAPKPKSSSKKKETLTDTQSWVMPVFLALVLPFVFDAKIVVSESPVPLFNSGADFEETVFIDAPHSFAELLVKKLRLRLDEILPNLQRLVAAYVIHLDANARQAKGGYDANWGRLSELTRDLTSSPLYVFHYLNVWLRKQDRDAPPISRVREYLNLYDFIETEKELKAMNHPRKLTELYRRFYRAKGFKSNAILKPIDFAADTILKADRSLFSNDDGALTDAVAASLNKLLDRVLSSAAEGCSPTKGAEERRLAVREFAEYFVNDLFIGALKGDAARLAGQQLNLLRDTCDTLYREMSDRERAEKRAAAVAAGIESTDNNEELED